MAQLIQKKQKKLHQTGNISKFWFFCFIYIINKYFVITWLLFISFRYNSIRALFGIDVCKNAIHASDTISNAEKEINILFPEYEELRDDIKPTIERTLALIKPDLYAEGKKDEIMSIIQEKGYTVIAEHEFQLEPKTVSEFYKEHENQPFFEDLVNYISG